MLRFLVKPAVSGFLLAAPVLVFFAYFFLLQYNIPWFDEYENIPYFLQQFLDAGSFGERLEALLRPNNEHRVLYARLVVYGQYLLTGGLSFTGLMLWGNLGLVVILGLLYQTTRWQARSEPAAQTPPLFWLLPVPLLLFTAQNYLLTFTAIYTLQYLAIIMLVMLTFFTLALDRSGTFVGAMALGALATFSMGNGILLWPAGAAMLLMRRRWRWLALWVLCGLGCSWLYFRNYPVQQGNSEGFIYVLQHPLQTLAGFFVFAGSVFDVFPAWPVSRRAVLPLLGGGVGVSWLTWWLVRTMLKKPADQRHFDVFLAGVALFLLANMALIAVFRIRFYFGMVLHSSYRTYALVLWGVAYLTLVQTLSPRRRLRWVPVLWVLLAGLNVLSYITYVPEALQRRRHMQGLTFNQQHNRIGLGGTQGSPLARWIIELDSTMRVRQWYTLPRPAIGPGEDDLLAPPPTPTPGDELRFVDQPEYITVESDSGAYRAGLTTGTYLVFWPQVNSNGAYVMFAEPHRPTGLNPFARPHGWTASMPKALLPPGPYLVGRFDIAAGLTRLTNTGRIVQVR